MNCGVIGSRNSQPAGTPSSARSQEQAARETQPAVDVKAPVEVRVVDESLPADGAARLLEVDAHDDQEVRRQPSRGRAQLACIGERRLRVMDRARPHDHDQSIVPATQAGAHRGAPPRDGLRRGGAERELLRQDRRGQERAQPLDSQVVGAMRHGEIVGAGGRTAKPDSRGRACAAAEREGRGTDLPGRQGDPGTDERARRSLRPQTARRVPGRAVETGRLAAEVAAEVSAVCGGRQPAAP